MNSLFFLTLLASVGAVGVFLEKAPEFATSAADGTPARPPGYRNAWDDCGGVGASATERMRQIAAGIKGWAKPLPFVRHAAQDCGSVDPDGTKPGPGAPMIYPGPEITRAADDGLAKAGKTLTKYPAEKKEVRTSIYASDFMQQPKPPAGHSKSDGAAGGIIGILEVAESDLMRNLAEIRQEEETAQEEYDKTTQENKITKATKEQDVKYKSKEKTSLEKFVAEATTDRDGAQTELDAVLEYLEKLKDQCIAKPEPYEERKKRREAEIAGLKEALAILEGESAAALVQTGGKTRVLRGTKPHA